MSTTFVLEDQEIRIPPWVVDLASFRKWGRSDEFPEHGRICYLGEVWIDPTMEQLFTHNQVKNEIGYVLTGLSKKECSGTYFPDGASLTNVIADISTVPDGLFVLLESFQDGSVKLCEGARTGFVEIEGTPDMVLEIVSDSSTKKDKTTLKGRYAVAGIPEYWLVDARKEPAEFAIFRLGAKGYKATPKKAGWVKSKVFGKEFRLRQSENSVGHPQFSLETR